MLDNLLECEIWRDEVQVIHDKLRESGHFDQFRKILDDSKNHDFDHAVLEFRESFPGIL